MSVALQQAPLPDAIANRIVERVITPADVSRMRRLGVGPLMLEFIHADETRKQAIRDELGRLQWAAPQDWMCEPAAIQASGLSVAEHQKLTIESVLTLRWEAPDIPWVPVLQGWEVDDYLRHVDQYTAAGIDLEQEPTVGVGSVCRRQATSEIGWLFQHLRPLRLHGFGVKQGGLQRYGWRLQSADSLAWSYAARASNIRLPGHTHSNCTNCLQWALQWRRQLLETVAAAPIEPTLFDVDN